MPLLDAKVGKRYKVVKITGGHCLLSRLTALGVFPDSELKLIKSSPGPFIIEVSGTRYAIGRGMARKIYVEEVDETKKEE